MKTHQHLLQKKFTKILKQISRRNTGRDRRTQNNKNSSSNASTSRQLGKPNSTNGFRQSSESRQSTPYQCSNRPQRSDIKLRNKGIQCREREGYGHIHIECPTYLKRKKSMTTTTQSDEEPKEENMNQKEEEIFRNFVAFTVQITELESKLVKNTNQIDEDKMSYPNLEDAHM